MSAVAKALEPLDELARQWVISWTASRFGARCWHQGSSLALLMTCIESSAVLKYGRGVTIYRLSRASDRSNGGDEKWANNSSKSAALSRLPTPSLPLDYQLTS